LTKSVIAVYIIRAHKWGKLWENIAYAFLPNRQFSVEQNKIK